MFFSKNKQDNVSKSRMVMVSSFGVSCGIAQYLEYLLISLKENSDLDIEVAPLPINLFRKKSSFSKQLLKKELKDIVQKCKEADVVSLQFEHGLYGRSMFSIWSNLSKIIRASKYKLIITHHTCLEDYDPFVFSLHWLKRVLSTFRRNWVIKKMLNLCKKRKNTFHIVHTAKDKENMSCFFEEQDCAIYDIPLSFLTLEEKRKFMGLDKEKEKKNLGIEPDKKNIGVFGFLHQYKGIEIALLALQQLPENYHLYIVGGLHSVSIEKYKVFQKYIKILCELVEKHTLQSRVCFLGPVDNERFVRVMNVMDFVVLPYSEVSQSGSGPAALALELQKEIFCSRNSCFTQLSKYADKCLTFFEISNYIELANKIERRSGTSQDLDGSIKQYNEVFNVEALAKLYHSIAREK